MFDDNLRGNFYAFLQPIFIYHAVNFTNLRLHRYIESFYTYIILN